MQAGSRSTPTKRYRRFGDMTPDKETLSNLYEELSTDRYLSALAKAHVSIDLASQVSTMGGNYGKWLGRSRAILESIFALDLDLGDTPPAQARTEATIMLAQIPLWQAIITNNPSRSPSYEDLLQSVPALMQNAPQSGAALTKTMEFVPLLLGQRAYEKTGVGWVGRTALRREDCRIPSRELSIETTGSYNWDIGYTFDPDFPASLQYPPHKRNNKLGFEPGKDDYKNGIRPLVSRQVGTNNIRDILSGCLQEFGEAKSPIGSLELDDITGELYENLKLNKIDESA